MKKAFFILKNVLKSILITAVVGIMSAAGVLIYAARGGNIQELPVVGALIFPDADGENVLSEREAENKGADGHAVETQIVQIQEDVQDAGEETEEAEELTQEQRLLLQEQQTGFYAYQMLSEEEQTLYIEILWAVTQFQENVTLSSVDSEEIARIFQCVLNDHPEIFYIDGYTYTQYTLGDILRKITFTGNYRFSREEVAKRQLQIDDYVDRCFANLAADADEYETVKYVYEYLINNTEYDAAAEDNQNICSVFLDGRSVCQGYAKATQYLLNRAGINATLVLGDVSEGEGHAWNLVQIDGEWYYVDTTWGDASYQTAGGEPSYPENRIPTINYDYLCVTTNQLCKTHRIDNVVELPECSSIDANYYVREGLYVTSLDDEQLQRIFQDGYEKGSAYVTLKCASAEIYEQMQERLIQNQEIFHYLDCPDGVVSYTDNEAQYSMSFWL